VLTPHEKGYVYKAREVDSLKQNRSRQDCRDLLPVLLSVPEQAGELHGVEAVEWIRDAAHVAQWWVAENWRHYEFVPDT
jgi:hypothetical protein